MTATRYTLAEMEKIAETKGLDIEYNPPSLTYSQWHVRLTERATQEVHYSSPGSWGDTKRKALNSALRCFGFIPRDQKEKP